MDGSLGIPKSVKVAPMYVQDCVINEENHLTHARLIIHCFNQTQMSTLYYIQKSKSYLI